MQNPSRFSNKLAGLRSLPTQQEASFAALDNDTFFEIMLMAGHVAVSNFAKTSKTMQQRCGMQQLWKGLSVSANKVRCHKSLVSHSHIF